MTKEERSIVAEKHFKEMTNDNFILRITKNSQANSVIYDKNHYPKFTYDNSIEVIDSTTENAIAKYAQPFKQLCVLNFASFTRPGGGFIKGAIAQEEALCHVSNLYNVLLAFKDEYNKNFNKSSFETGLYEDWGIFSPSVYFKFGENSDLLVNVITCPAPNYNVYKKYCSDENLYLKTLESRIKFVLDMAKVHDQEILILGAFGCGVFGNDSTLVASIFKSQLRNYKFEKVIFAIPDNGNGNYVAFKKVFNDK